MMSPYMPKYYDIMTSVMVIITVRYNSGDLCFSDVLVCIY